MISQRHSQSGSNHDPIMFFGGAPAWIIFSFSALRVQSAPEKRQVTYSNGNKNQPELACLQQIHSFHHQFCWPAEASLPDCEQANEIE
jgi:hypothetical protein